MKTRPLISLFLLFGAASMLSADIPRKAPITRYTDLWTNSPFTSKPLPPVATAANNPLEDYTLTGIAPVPGGYRITVVNKKNPDEKVVIEPNGSSNFELISVNRNPEVSLGTTVVLSANGMQGTVTFEPGAIALNKPPTSPQQQPEKNPDPQTGANPSEGNQNQNQGNPNQANQPNRAKPDRPKIVPPPGNRNNTDTQTRERRRR